MPDLRGTTLGRFTLIDLLGRGGMGEVYRARDESLHRDVAVKILPPELTSHPGRIERFVQEARAASALNHPHLTAVYEIGHDPIHYIAMELVRGRTLRAVFDAGRPDLKRFLDWMLQVSDALGAAHEAGVVHRDIKPENVMIADDGYAKVLDFGVAKLRADEMPGDEAATRAALTGGGMTVGTSGYMSPEQARGYPTDRRTDIFSLGCVLYEGLAGGAAFDAPSIIERLHRVIHDEPTPLQSRTQGLPVELLSLVRKCLAKDPEDRYQSMKDVAIDLRYVRRQLDTGTAAIAPPAPSSRTLRPAWIAVVVAAVAIAGVGGVALYRRAPRPAQPAVASGQPVTIERLTTSGDTISAAISPDGKSIARVEAVGNRQSLWIHDVASGQEREIVPVGQYAFYGEQFSPDGKSVAFTTRGQEHGSGRLSLISIDGGTSRALLTGILTPVTYAPDGKRLAFMREGYPDQDSSALIVVNSDGSSEHVLATRHNPDVFTPAFFTAASWSPDGKRIAVSSRNVSTEDAQLVEIDVESGKERELYRSKNDITSTLWLPDGSGLLFVSRPFVLNLGSPAQLWLKPYPDGPARRITTDLIDYRSLSIDGGGRNLISVGGEYRASLYNVPLDGSPLRRIRSDRYDGIQGIAPLTGGGLVTTTVVRGETQILRLSEDGATRTVLTSEGANTFPAVSPDGSTIAMVSTRDGGSGVWRMNVDGSDQRLLAHIPAARWLSIAADPLRVICTSYKGATTSTWAVPMDGGQAVEISRDLDRAVVSPDGKWLGGLYAPRQGVTSSGVVAAVLPLDGRGPIRPLARLIPATDMGLLVWARDGSGLIATTSARLNLNFYGIDGSAARELTNLADEVLVAGALSVDGKSVVAARGVLSRDVFAIKGVTAR